MCVLSVFVVLDVEVGKLEGALCGGVVCGVCGMTDDRWSDIAVCCQPERARGGGAGACGARRGGEPG